MIDNEIDEIFFSDPQACKKISKHFSQMQAIQEQVFSLLFVAQYIFF